MMRQLSPEAIKRFADEYRSPESKHTPGPWKCEQSGYANAPFVVFTGEVSPQWNRRYPLTGVNWIAEVKFDESEQHKEHCANARLIASAPDLLEAIRKIAATTHHILLDGKGLHSKECPACIAEMALLKAAGDR